MVTRYSDVAGVSLDGVGRSQRATLYTAADMRLI